MGFFDIKLAILELGQDQGLFRTRDLPRHGVHHGWLEFFGARKHAFGVWSDGDYEPSRYEVVQTRTPHLVFCRSSALFLHGLLEREPDTIQVAIGIASRRPVTLGPGVDIFRSRRLEEGLVTLLHGGGRVRLRVHSPERARADLLRSRTRRASDAPQTWRPAPRGVQT